VRFSFAMSRTVRSGWATYQPSAVIWYLAIQSFTCGLRPVGVKLTHLLNLFLAFWWACSDLVAVCVVMVAFSFRFASLLVVPFLTRMAGQPKRAAESPDVLRHLCDGRGSLPRARPLHHRCEPHAARHARTTRRRLHPPTAEPLHRDRTAVYSTSGISKSFLVKNSTRPLATATGFLPGKSWLAHGIDTVSISGIHCWSRSATSKNTGNVSLPRIDSTGCRISFRPTRGHHTRCPPRSAVLVPFVALQSFSQSLCDEKGVGGLLQAPDLAVSQCPEMGESGLHPPPLLRNAEIASENDDVITRLEVLVPFRAELVEVGKECEEIINNRVDTAIDAPVGESFGNIILEVIRQERFENIHVSPRAVQFPDESDLRRIR